MPTIGVAIALGTWHWGPPWHLEAMNGLETIEKEGLNLKIWIGARNGISRYLLIVDKAKLVNSSLQFHHGL